MNWEVLTMRSKTSFFNRTLFRKNLSCFWPLWGFVSFCGALLPLAGLVELLQHGGTTEPLEMTMGYYNVLTYGVPVVSLIYAVLCGLAVWNYLYSARSVSLMHTLPIRREGLFVTNFLSGMAMMLIPYAVSGALCILVSLCCGGFEPVGLLVTIAGVAAESFFFFAFATLAAFLTGNVFAMPAAYFLLNFLAVIVDALLSVFVKGFLFGLSGSYSGSVEYLSPVVYLMKTLGVSRHYAETGLVDEGGWSMRGPLDAVTVDNGWLIAVYAAVGVLFVLASFALYRRRRSECAGDVVAVGWMKPIFRYGMAAGCGIGGGMLLYALFFSAWDFNEHTAPAPMALCMTVAGLIGYYAAGMLLSKSLRVFRKSWIGAAAVAVFSLALCFGLYADPLGIAARVPETQSIETLSFSLAGNHYELTPGKDDALIEEVRALHETVYAQRHENDAAQQRCRELDYDYGEDFAYEYLELNYHLKNGANVIRRYDLALEKDRMEDEGSYGQALDRFVNGALAKAKRLHANDPDYTVSGGSFWSDVSGSNYDLGTREVRQLYAAVMEDAAEGTWGTYDWFDESDCYAMSLSFRFETASNSRADYIDVLVRPGMVHTKEALLALGYCTERDFVTWAEYDGSAYERYLYDRDGSVYTSDGDYIGCFTADADGTVWDEYGNEVGTVWDENVPWSYLAADFDKAPAAAEVTG